MVVASCTTLSQLNNIQRKALKIIGVNEATACTQLSISSLTHRREVAAVIVFYKMYTRHCPIDLYKLLPPPLKRKHMTRYDARPCAHCTRCQNQLIGQKLCPFNCSHMNSLPDAIVGDLHVQLYLSQNSTPSKDVHMSFSWIALTCRCIVLWNLLTLLFIFFLSLFELQWTIWLAQWGTLLLLRWAIVHICILY